ALLIGWLWFVGTLVPVIGLFQVGDQAMADRFVYVPHIGLFIGLVWSAAALLDGLRVPAAAQIGLASVAVLACAVVTFGQVKTWRDTETIWLHALAVDRNNHRAHTNLGQYYLGQGKAAVSRRHYQAAVDLQPDVADFNYNLGVVLLLQGENELAVQR